MEPQAYTYNEFLESLTPAEQISDAVTVFAREQAFSVLGPDAVENSGYEAYSPDIGGWLAGEKRVTVYPNEMSILIELVGPASSLLMGNPIPLLVDLCVFLVKFRISNKVHPLSVPETAVYLYLNEFKSEWTSRSDLEKHFGESPVDIEEAISAIDTLANLDVVECRDSELRIAREYLD